MRVFAALFLFAALQDDAVELKFKYAPGDKESVVMDCTLEMEVSVHAGAEKHEQKMSGPIKLTLNLNCPKEVASKSLDAEAGLTKLVASFSDPEMTQNVTMGDTTFELSVKGEKVLMKTEDGKVIIDTENGVNPEAAAEIIKEMAFSEKAEFQLDPRGIIKGKGSEKVKELFGGVVGDNLFPLVLPEKAAGTGSTWQYKVLMDKLGKMKFGKAVEVPLNFKLEKFEGEGARRVAVISLKQDVSLKNIECAGEMDGVGKAKMVIKKLSISMTGESRFNVTKGRLAKASVTGKVSGTIEVTPEAIDQTMDVHVDVTIKATMEPK